MRVAISGCGVAGPTLAWWLKRAGHEPTLIETAESPRTGGYIIDFWGVGYTVAERMGLLPRIHEVDYAVEEVRIVDERNRKAGGFSTEIFRKALRGRFASLPRGDLASIIYKALGSEVEALFAESIETIDQRPDQVTVGLRHGGEREFDLVFGADGLHSQVRSLVFGPTAAFERRIGYRVAAFEVAGYRPRDERAYVSHGLPGRQISRFALRGDRTLFLLVFTEDRLEGALPYADPDIRAALRHVFDGVGWEWPRIREAMEGARDIYLDEVSQIVMDRWSRGRVCLVGDAAACVSLLAGEGTGLAMAEAYVAAGELARAEGDHAVAFDAYERRLRRLIEGKQKAARGFAGAFAPRTALGLWLRNQVSRLVSAPLIGNVLLLNGVRDNIEVPAYRL